VCLLVHLGSAPRWGWGPLLWARPGAEAPLAEEQPHLDAADALALLGTQPRPRNYLRFLEGSQSAALKRDVPQVLLLLGAEELS
jgi:hypothetical protein